MGHCSLLFPPSLPASFTHPASTCHVAKYTHTCEE
jgi:hypothetical protein